MYVTNTIPEYVSIAMLKDHVRTQVLGWPSPEWCGECHEVDRGIEEPTLKI